jgi:hypothetical protein
MYKAARGLTQLTPGNRRDQLVRQIALLAQTAALAHQFIDALVSAQGRLNGPLARHVGAQTHRGKHVQALDVIAGSFLSPEITIHPAR